MAFRIKFGSAILVSLLLLGACGSNSGNTGNAGSEAALSGQVSGDDGSSIFDLFKRSSNESIVKVNKYIWAASLDVLDFLPVQSVDPFTGVIVTGYGTPPGGARAYRATIYIQDPALDARSLKLALLTKRGPVAAETTRKIEDAILTRARQLRERDSRL